MKWQWNEGEGKEAASDNAVEGTHGPMGPTPCHEVAASSFPHLTSPELHYHSLKERMGACTDR